MYGLSIVDKSGDLAWTLTYFSGRKIFPERISRRLFCRSTTKFGHVRDLANRNLFPAFVNFGLAVPWYHAATSIFQWYTCKVVFRQLLPLSIHCVAQELGASFLYKYSTSSGGSLREHGFLVLVMYLTGIYLPQDALRCEAIRRYRASKIKDFVRNNQLY